MADPTPTPPAPLTIAETIKAQTIERLKSEIEAYEKHVATNTAELEIRKAQLAAISK